MAFKLGSETRDGVFRKNASSSKRVFRKNSEMGLGVVAQANNDGSIDIDPNVDTNSRFGKRVVKHELKHSEQMENGKADYGDNWVMWEDKIYLRKEEDGKPVIDGPNGRWPEGHPNHPWEAEAMEAEDQ
tara:strand:+ start:763 stop:1149 length:387 start_codon:yes stop_codon:yes gene_type:complete